MDYQIIKTLAYFDVFDYPLTFSELKKYLGVKIDCSDDDLLEIIDSISIVQESNGYYYLLGRQEVVDKRTENANTSIQKFGKAQIISKLLSAIPTVEYIGVSGSLSMNNATYSDDIDFFITTRPGTLWITRFLVTAFLFLSNQKRKRKKGEVRDKICPNMFLASDSLSFLGTRKSLFTAHEIVQLKTLYDKKNICDELLIKNKWLNYFLPNVEIPQTKKNNDELNIFDFLLKPIEKIAYFLQYKYLKRHKTGETVSKNRAMFHPTDKQKIILDLYKLRYRRYEKLYMENLWVDPDEARFYMEEKKIRILN